MTDQELVARAFSMHRFFLCTPIPAFLWEPLCCAGTALYLPAAMWRTPPLAPRSVAERTALLKAVSEGHRDDWTTIAIAGRGGDYCWPCGSCRQMLYEFAPGCGCCWPGGRRLPGRRSGGAPAPRHLAQLSGGNK